MNIIKFIFTFIDQIFDGLISLNNIVNYFLKNLFPISNRESTIQDVLLIEAFTEVIKDEEFFKIEDLDEIRQLRNSLEIIQNKPVGEAYEVISEFLTHHPEERNKVIYLIRPSQTRQIEFNDFHPFNPKNEERVLKNSFPRLIPKLNQMIERLDKQCNKKKPSN